GRSAACVPTTRSGWNGEGPARPGSLRFSSGQTRRGENGYNFLGRSGTAVAKQTGSGSFLPFVRPGNDHQGVGRHLVDRGREVCYNRFAFVSISPGSGKWWDHAVGCSTSGTS